MAATPVTPARIDQMHVLLGHLAEQKPSRKLIQQLSDCMQDLLAAVEYRNQVLTAVEKLGTQEEIYSSDPKVFTRVAIMQEMSMLAGYVAEHGAPSEYDITIDECLTEAGIQSEAVPAGDPELTAAMLRLGREEILALLDLADSPDSDGFLLDEISNALDAGTLTREEVLAAANGPELIIGRTTTVIGKTS